MVALVAFALLAQEYSLGPESTTRLPGAPVGTITAHKWTNSKIYPGTVRDYWIYVPAQYKGDKPYPVMIFQDGVGYVNTTEKGHSRIPIVFDNLIHKGDIPPMIGVFVNPGVLPMGGDRQDRFHRSFEYDALGDRYARFLIEEILPEVAKTVKISSDPSDRAIGGSSSGGIAAFNAAWQRPDAFRRVLCFIGSFTNLRGGESLATLIRKYENKPLRIFLQDGNRDNNIYAGSWWVANQDVAASLEFSGYDYKFVTGTEAHNMKHGGAIMPEALRWLWRDYPKPIAVARGPKGDRHMASAILGNSEWEMVSSGHRFTEGPAVNRAGEVFFTDIPNNRIHRIALDGKVSVFKEDTGAANGLMFGADGLLYACQNGRKRIVAYTPAGEERVIAEDVQSNDLVVTAKGDIYFTDPPNKQVWLVRKGEKRVVYKATTTGPVIERPNGIVVMPDQAFVMVADSLGKWVWSFQIADDGALVNGEPFFRLETPDDSSASGADGMTVDTEGFLYTTTKVGLQISDPPGRVNAIAVNPLGQRMSNAVFGGPGLDWLYVTAGDKVFRRKVLRKGFWPWEAAKPPAPRL
jgi:sugar lactone lactonase YvrE/enterochelin esterase-like enzyme